MALTLRDKLASVNAGQFVRFVVVGIVNTIFSFSIYSLLISVGAGYALANLVALVLGILFSFKTQGALVFANTDNRRLLRFAIAWAVLYAINVMLIGQFIRLGFDAYASGALAIPFVTVLSFAAQKLFVFRAPHRRSD